MQVILTKDVPDLGAAGQMVHVRNGYGANFLIPRGLAVLATLRNQHEMEHQRRRIEAQIVKEKQKAQELAKKLGGVSVTLTRLVAADEKDKIFGSVTTQDIADALKNEGYAIDKRNIVLDNALKSLGVYEVPVKLHRDVTANVKVWVVAD
ncbi:MAG: 50S ribosomal protein L9 [Deltaproteobacteria bacterium]|nr:50S ribosomal protein L9 [Deltaproteobacteria bacterium]